MTDDRHHPPTEPEASVGGRPVSRVTHTFVVGNDFFGEKWMAECTCGWDADDRFPSRMQAKDAHTAHIAETVIALSEELDRLRDSLAVCIVHHGSIREINEVVDREAVLVSIIDRMKAWEPMHVTDAPHWGIKGGWYWRYRTPYGPKPEPMTPDQMAYFEDGGEKEGS